jgi:ribonuclease P protein component
MIEHLFKSARRVKTSRFLISYAKLENKTNSLVSFNLKNPCISMVVSKKHAKTAVLRNKLRRKGYAAVSPLSSKIQSNMGILVSFNDGNPDFSNSEATNELDFAFKKAGLYK